MNITKPVKKRILVIKLGAMGDIVQATGPFEAIRSHHLNSHITLLTTNKYVDFAKSGNWFLEPTPRAPLLACAASGIPGSPWYGAQRFVSTTRFTRSRSHDR